MLTPVQRKALDFIRGYIEEHGGISPAYSEIKRALGLKSASGINLILIQLEQRGHIRRLHHRSRAIEVVKEGSVNAQALLAQAPEPPINFLRLSLAALQTWDIAYRQWWERTRTGK